MNILFIAHNVDYSGSSRSLMNLLEGLQEYDIYSIVVVQLKASFQKPFPQEKSRIKLHLLSGG